MTATQVLFLFLKECCTIDEMRFFKHVIMKDNGNKYFRKRPLFTPTFVEDYLARNNRCLNNYMTRLFILAPNLKNNRHRNPRWGIIRKEYNERNRGKSLLVRIKDWKGNETGETFRRPCEFQMFNSGMYIRYYQRKWNEFLKENINSEKKFNSPFKKGESYDFKLKTKDDICL
jgi:hypothetical protein